MKQTTDLRSVSGVEGTWRSVTGGVRTGSKSPEVEPEA